jgi:hypothetical protein
VAGTPGPPGESAEAAEAVVDTRGFDGVDIGDGIGETPGTPITFSSSSGRSSSTAAS